MAKVRKTIQQRPVSPFSSFLSTGSSKGQTRTWGMSKPNSNRFDRDHGQIIHQPDLFLQEGFSVLDAAQHSVESRHRRDAVTNLRISREVAPPSFLISELGFVGVNGFQAGFELLGN